MPGFEDYLSQLPFKDKNLDIRTFPLSGPILELEALVFLI